MTDSEILDAAEAYEEERRLWTVRKNKMIPVQWEVVRAPDDGDPEVVITAIDSDVADYEKDEQRMLAAMKAALRACKQ